MSFWDFERYSKINELTEPSYTDKIVTGLCDSETCIEHIDDNRYIIFNEVEALLVSPSSVNLKIGLILYCFVVRYMRNLL